MMYSKRHLPDIESSGARAVAPTSSRGGLVLAWLAYGQEIVSRTFALEMAQAKA